MNTITLSNQKGGVAKTTTAGALAAGLSVRGFRVLAVDCDPQCNLCLTADVNVLELKKTLYDVMKGNAAVRDVIVQSDHGYAVVPGGLALASADMDFTQTGREYMLSEILSEVDGEYDYCIIDTPPTLGILTVNALACSDGVIIPMTADIYSIQGLSHLNTMIGRIRKYCNRDLKVYGLLITRYNGRQTVSRTITDQIKEIAESIGTKVFDTKIRESVAVREAAYLQTDFLTEAPKANATIDYNSFITEFLGE